MERLDCPACNRGLQRRGDLAGRQLKRPACGEVFEAPHSRKPPRRRPKKSVFGASLCLAIGLAAAARAAAPDGYRPKVTVAAATRLDWTFALSNQSLADPPADWLKDYDSTTQQYELYVPPKRDPKKPLPVIVFVSPGDEPMGWKAFEAVCKDQSFLFAGPRDAGNDCPPKRRVRAVLDVLDDVRRHYPTDPDRTYLAGFSGGGRIACAVAFALPECFGGVMPICASGDLRDEPWLRRRAIDRLSGALMTGDNDFNRGEVERLRGPFLKEVGVRARVWRQAGLGHGIPGEKQLSEAVKWLDADVDRRRKLAKEYPATRVAGDAAPTREEAAKALLAEGQKRLEAKETLYGGLMLLQGCMNRWPDLPAADEAKKILLDYDGRKEHPWEADDVAEQRRFLIAQARSLDAYASGDFPAQYAKERPGAAKQAMELWQKVLDDGADADACREAKKRIPALEKLAGVDESVRLPAAESGRPLASGLPSHAIRRRAAGAEPVAPLRGIHAAQRSSRPVDSCPGIHARATINGAFGDENRLRNV